MAKVSGNGVKVMPREIMDPIIANQYETILGRVNQVLNAATSTRRIGDQAQTDERRNLNDTCGFPETQNIRYDTYYEQYKRNPYARKVVDLLPDHCWKIQPSIFETEDREENTPFERDFIDLCNGLRGTSWHKRQEGSLLWSYLKRVDQLSGIGNYGVILLGVDGEDGADLNKPLTPKKGRKLTHLRVFPQNLATIATHVNDRTDIRNGLPESYDVTFDEAILTDTLNPSTDGGTAIQTHTVHWTRVIHIAEELSTSEYLAIPRMLPVLNPLLSIDKILSGSGETYWQGGLGLISFETHPQLGGDVEVDEGAIRTQMEYLMNDLQRYLVTTGLQTKSIAPQTTDPKAFLEAQIEAICVAKDIPKRILIGSERGELASSDDRRGWNDFLQSRRIGYLTPRMIVPFIDRCIWLGILSEPGEDGYSIDWEIKDILTPEEKALVAVHLTDAIVKYIAGDGVALMQEVDFLVHVIGLEEETAVEIVDNALGIIRQLPMMEEEGEFGEGESEPKEKALPKKDTPPKPKVESKGTGEVAG